MSMGSCRFVRNLGPAGINPAAHPETAGIIPAARHGWHSVILAGVVAGALVLYAHTLLRCGSVLRTTDGYMYYLHAQSWYFDRDGDCENQLRSVPPAFKHADFYLKWRSPQGKVMNVFPCGWALVAFPFLALADLLTVLHNTVFGTALARDGYTFYYQAVVPLGHVLLGIAGLLLGYALLARHFPKPVAAGAVALVWCGTHVMYYVSVDPTMTHSASMAFVTGVLWMSDTIRRRGWSVGRAVGLGSCVGMMAAVRHQDIAWTTVPLMMLGPALAAEVIYRRPGWGHRLACVVLAVTAAGLCFLPQIMVNWSSQGAAVGHVSTWTPHWSDPQFARELFAASTGLVTVYPLVAVGLIGLAAHLVAERQSLLPVAMLVGFGVLLYVNACWPWCHSPRRYVCGMALWAYGVACILVWASRSRPRRLAVVLVLSVLCLRSVAMVFDPYARFA